GDEGKGKIVDYLAEKADYVVRSQGGSNAGHTVVVGDKTYKLRLLPSGILYKGKVCVLGNGVVIDPKVFLAEMDDMEKQGIDLSQLRISNRAHIILPYHRLLDRLQEERRGIDRLGTTQNGIGPCYMDKSSRMGIRMVDLLDAGVFKQKLKFNVEAQNDICRTVYGHAGVDYDDILAEYLAYADRLRPYVVDTTMLLGRALDAGKKVLFEGAQAMMLDLDHGTYPFVTSSNPSAGGACVGAGVGPGKIELVIGVVKAYATRVGEGPFPSEVTGEVGEMIRRAGHEYGTVTGRARRCGWLDTCVIRYACYVNGLDYLAVTRLDILSRSPKVKLCVAYRHRGKLLDEYPADLNVLGEVEPVYEELDGWCADISHIRTYDELPDNAKKYLARIGETSRVKIGIVSVGPARDQTIDLIKIWQ
ncbi:MAG: adenylosuccinate synthase, partial [Selenomonadales bacterium]|nr:adenylosuccinate synthase [Selenomonadales bacterium]